MNRSERREEIKLRLEYAKLGGSIAGLILIVIAVLQWDTANKNSAQAVYQKMAKEWNDHLKLLVEKPTLRPYFEERRPLPADEDLRQQIFAMGDLRIDTMDAILTFAQIQGASDEIEGWRKTFHAAFRTSAVLCAQMHSKQEQFGLIVPISKDACGTAR